MGHCQTGISLFLWQINNFHPTLLIYSGNFRHRVVYREEHFQKEAIPALHKNSPQTNWKVSVHTLKWHPVTQQVWKAWVKKGLIIKGKYIRFLRTNSWGKAFQESLSNFKTCLYACGYPKNFVERTISEVTFARRQLALQQKKTHQQINIINPFAALNLENRDYVFSTGTFYNTCNNLKVAAICVRPIASAF